MDEEPDLEGLISQDNQPNQDSKQDSRLVNKIKHHAPYFVVDGSTYVIFYGLFMTGAERLSGMNWEEVKRTRGIGAVTGFLSGYIVNWLRGRFGKNANETKEKTASKRKKMAVDLAVGFVTTMPFYLPILYGGRDADQGIMVPVVIGSAVSAVAGLGYGRYSDWCRKRLGLPPVLYK
ncbi:MAG TPA: L-alanine exporter AlaE [Candidatus Nanoarchaeia archaeon]|nr:L-alanine exporter AlaE [Candidatus Nanoarchaeia archaeon]